MGQKSGSAARRQRWDSTARLALGLGFAALLATCSSTPKGPPSAQHDICAIFAQYPEWRDITRDVERKWGAPVVVQMAIIQQESSFRAEARPPMSYAMGVVPVGRASSAYGFSQAIDGTWDWYRKETGNSSADRTDFEDAADFVGWYMAKTASTNGVPLYDGYNQYLAYHEGHTGYKRASYTQKPWLMEVAGRVAARVTSYQGQLRSCS